MPRENILIVGVGQLGSRYLQGLAKFPRPLNIFLSDPSSNAVVKALALWRDNSSVSSAHNVFRLSDGLDIEEQVDLAIVATNADVRPGVVRSIKNQYSVKNWILEKVLAQSEAGIQDIVDCIGSSPAWVNTPMHIYSLYKNLRSALPSGLPLHATVNGFEALACSSIHFIDFIARCNSAQVLRVDAGKIESEWVTAKRQGFMEVNGELSVGFSDGSTLLLRGRQDGPKFYQAEILCNGENWDIREEEGRAISSLGRRVSGRVEYQSEITSSVVDSILTGGHCALPTLLQSAQQHRHLLNALLRNWILSSKTSDLCVPIT